MHFTPVCCNFIDSVNTSVDTAGLSVTGRWLTLTSLFEEFFRLDYYHAAWNADAVYSDENSVCPSVCPSNAWNVIKRKKDVFRFLYHSLRKIIYPSFLRKIMVVGGDLFYLKLLVNRPPLMRNRRFWTDNRS